eukprot:gene13705-9817_t
MKLLDEGQCTTKSLGINLPNCQCILRSPTLEGECNVPPLSTETQFFQFTSEYKPILRGHSLPLRIFLRNENWEIARELDSFLASELQLFYLQGPPGVGKTKESLLWMLQSIVKGSQAKDYPGPWAWIPLAKSAACGDGHTVYLLVKSGASSTVKYTKFRTSKLSTHLCDWGVTLVVFDHCNGDNRSPVDACAHQGFKTIAVSSMQMKYDMSFGEAAYAMNGWKKEEYLEACKDAAFYELVKAALQTGDFTDDELNNPAMRDEVVAAKHHLAGGSARWMFQFSTDQLLSSDDGVGSINNLLARLTPVQMESGFYGDRSITEVNHMLTRIDGCPVIVSQYVANCLVTRFGEALMKAAQVLVRGSSNPAMDGILMGMEFVYRLGRSTPEKTTMIHLITEQGAEPIAVFESGGKTISFRLSTLASGTLTVVDGDWFVPQVFNNGGFDCVQYRAGKLIFVQVPRSEKHSFNLKWYQKFRTAFVEVSGLTITECEVWFVVREEVVATFKSARSFGTLTGYEKGNYKVVGMRRLSA